MERTITYLGGVARHPITTHSFDSSKWSVVLMVVYLGWVRFALCDERHLRDAVMFWKKHGERIGKVRFVSKRPVYDKEVRL